jgi:hypothetical protein
MVTTVVITDRSALSRDTSLLHRTSLALPHSTSIAPNHASPLRSEMHPKEPPFGTSGAVLSAAMVRSTLNTPQLMQFWVN